jgi:hypothetical protein
MRTVPLERGRRPDRPVRRSGPWRLSSKGQRVRIEYHEEQRGEDTNIYLGRP